MVVHELDCLVANGLSGVDFAREWPVVDAGCGCPLVCKVGGHVCWRLERFPVADNAPLEGWLHVCYGAVGLSRHGRHALCRNALFWMVSALSGVVSTGP